MVKFFLVVYNNNCIMAPTYPPTQPVAAEAEGFPTAAIVVIAIGAYIVLFGVGLIIRKLILNKGDSCCPVWCSELCQCQSCCETPIGSGFLTSCAKACDCKIPNKQKCMDSCCPSKQWFDDTCCFCFSKQPEGQCCKCDDCACGECMECCECQDCCQELKCELCAQPETIGCCCMEVTLTGSNNRQNQPNVMHQPGYMNQYPGVPIGEQPGYMQQMSMRSQPGAFNNPPSHPDLSGSFYPGQMGQPPIGYNQFSGQRNMRGSGLGMSQTFSNNPAMFSTQQQPTGGMFRAQPTNV